MTLGTTLEMWNQLFITSHTSSGLMHILNFQMVPTKYLLHYMIFLAMIIWILGAGNPEQGLIYTVSAYYPVILGALVVIPTYFATKWIFNREVGLMASLLIAISCGQFLSRSMIGFNDHHIAETLLSTLTAMFMIMALKKINRNKFTFKDIKNKNYENIMPSIPFLIFTGITLGAYSLAWKGALFLVLLLVFT